MNLCHCSNSECSVCRGTRQLCKCLAVRAAKAVETPVVATPSAPPPPPPCTQCEVVKAQITKREKELAKRDKELGGLREQLAQSQAQEQRERDRRVSDAALQAKRIEALEEQLRSAQTRDPRQAELERALAAATQQAAAAEAKRGEAETSAARARDDIMGLRTRLADVESALRAAEESRVQYVAEAAEAAAREAALGAEAEAAREELDVLRCAAEPAAAQLRTVLAARDALEADLASSRQRLSHTEAELSRAQDEARGAARDKEMRLAYEGACADNRRLQAQLAEAEGRGREHTGRTAMVDELERQLEALTAQNAALTAQVKHAEHLRSLFHTVTSRTNEVQEAANSVIKQVEASKQARKESTRQQAPGSTKEAASHRPSTGQPLAPANYSRVPVPPSGAKTPRHGGPPDRGAVRR